MASEWWVVLFQMKLIFFVFLLLTEKVNSKHIHLFFSQTNILMYLLQAYVYLGIYILNLKKTEISALLRVSENEK